MTRTSAIVRIGDSSEVSSARRMAIRCAGELRLSETATARAALVATELGTNLVKHAQGGSILFGSDDHSLGVLTITSIDKGRGLGNAQAAMRDGYSTAGSSGTGLGAIRRATTFFDTYSLPQRGTAIVCRIADEQKPPAPPLLRNRITVSGICVPKPPETESGDAWEAVMTREVVTVSVVDGLGHGPAAALASATGVRIFREGNAHGLERMLQDAHAGMRATRGAAVGIARIHAADGRLEFGGVGNIAGIIIAEEGVRRVVSQNGIVGHEMRKVLTFSYPWTESSVLVLHSDGLSTSWNPAAYPGLMDRDPALIAAVLYRDHARGSDDATVVVAKAS